MYQTIDEKREALAIKTLADAVKSIDMTDKQILAVCRPKPTYYATTTKYQRRDCLWCVWHTSDPYTPYPETMIQIEQHYMEKHA